MDEQQRLSQVMPGWRIAERIGQGGYGTVYRIEKEQFHLQSALKVIRIPHDENERYSLFGTGMGREEISEYLEEIAESCLTEIHAMQELSTCPYVVEIQDCAVQRDMDREQITIYIRMELLEGLDRYLYRKKLRVLSREDTIRLGIQICQALEACEKKNILHRDIKPSNILVTANGDFKLGDFGVARQLGGTTSETLSRRGTPRYMAPEMESGHYGKSVNLYALGLVLYQYFNHGRLPLEPRWPAPMSAMAMEEATRRRMNGEPIPAPDDADERIAQILLITLSPDPARRFRSAAALRTALQEALKPEKPKETTEEPKKPKEKPKKPVENPSGPAEKPEKPAEGPKRPAENPSGPTKGKGKPKGHHGGRIVLAVVAVLVLAGVIVVPQLLQGSGSPAETDTPESTAEEKPKEGTTEEKPQEDTTEELREDTDEEREALIAEGAPEDALFAGGNAYAVFEDSSITSFDAAQAFCEKQGGSLAVISSAAQNEAIYDYVVDQGYTRAIFGYTDEAKEGSWTWVGNASTTYVAWADDEPNAASDAEDCAAFIGRKGSGSEWDDTEFGLKVSAFVCQWGDEGNDGDGSPLLSIPDDTLEYGDHSYKIYPGTGLRSYDAAQHFCKARGGHLAVIEDEEENQKLFDYMREQDYHQVLFGYTDEETEGTWKWVVGSSDYEDWGVNDDGVQEPNGDAKHEDYAALDDAMVSGTWNDVLFGSSYSTTAFLCEWDSTR